MDDEAIRAENAQDVSDAVDQTALEGETVEAQEQVDEQAVGDAINVSEDPVTRRERMMKEARDKARAQREADRKAAALINDPDMTEEEYDAEMERRQRAELEERKAELEAQLGETPDPREETPTDERIEASQTSDEDRAPSETGWFTKEDGTRVKRLRIDGQIRELTEEQYDRAVSKSLAGDQKLELANRVMQQAREREERIAQREAALKQMPSKPDVSIDEIKRKLDEYQEAFMEGDTDVARDKLAEILVQRASSPTPNLDALADEAATRVNQRMQADRQRESVQRGWDSFRKDYAEIASNEENLAIADVFLKRVRQEHPDWTPEQQIMETGKRTAERLGLKSASSSSEQAPVANPTDERAQRKSKLQPIPKAGGRIAKPQKEKIDMSPEAKIRRMRAARAVY